MSLLNCVVFAMVRDALHVQNISEKFQEKTRSPCIKHLRHKRGNKRKKVQDPTFNILRGYLGIAFW